MASAESGCGLVSLYIKPICYGDKILEKKLDIVIQTNENFYNNIEDVEDVNNISPIIRGQTFNFKNIGENFPKNSKETNDLKEGQENLTEKENETAVVQPEMPEPFPRNSSVDGGSRAQDSLNMLVFTHANPQDSPRLPSSFIFWM